MAVGQKGHFVYQTESDFRIRLNRLQRNDFKRIVSRETYFSLLDI